MATIMDSHLFDAVFHAASRRLDQGMAPTALLFPRETQLVRAVDAGYLMNRYHAFDPATVLQNLVVRDAYSDDHRFSGTGPQGPITNRGGLYTSRHTAPMTNEVWHYSSATTVPKALREKGVITLAVVQPLLVLDLSRYSASTTTFLCSLEQDTDVKSALNASRYKNAHLQQLVMLGGDYTVGRALGLAAATSSSVDGLQAGTARPSDRPGETGDNVVLYGPDGEPVCGKVEAASVTLFDYNGKTRELERHQHKLKFDQTKQLYIEA